MGLLHSTTVYHGSTSLFLNLGHPAIALLYLASYPGHVVRGYTLLYLTLYYTLNMVYFTLLHLPWLYFILLHFRLLYMTPHTLPGLYLILHYTTMVLLYSTWLYRTLPWLYFILFMALHSTTFYHGSTSLYLILRYSTRLYLTALKSTVPYLGSTFYCTAFYHGSTSLYNTL